MLQHEGAAPCSRVGHPSLSRSCNAERGGAGTPLSGRPGRRKHTPPPPSESCLQAPRLHAVATPPPCARQPRFPCRPDQPRPSSVKAGRASESGRLAGLIPRAREAWLRASGPPTGTMLPTVSCGGSRHCRLIRVPRRRRHGGLGYPSPSPSRWPGLSENLTSLTWAVRVGGGPPAPNRPNGSSGGTPSQGCGGGGCADGPGS